MDIESVPDTLPETLFYPIVLLAFDFDAFFELLT